MAKMPKLKDEVLCARCGKMHRVECAKEISKNGKGIPGKTLAFVRCRGKMFLAGVNGKDITLRFRKH